MGEPFHNIESVIKAADIMVHDQGLHFSPRKVTVSTSGLVPQLKHFLRESNCALAVSLNATTDEVQFFQAYFDWLVRGRGKGRKIVINQFFLLKNKVQKIAGKKLGNAN